MRVRDPLAIRLRLRGFDGPLRGAELPDPVQHELDGRPPELRDLLGHVREDPVVRYRYGSRIQGQLAAQQREQRELARTVRPDQADLLTAQARAARVAE